MVAVDYFKKITGFDIKGYFKEATTFIDEKYSSIVDYYSGEGNIDPNAFNQLDELVSNSTIISNLFEINKNILSQDIQMWDLLDYFEQISLKLKTIKNTPKWIRASFSKDFEKDDNVDYILPQNKTLEELSRELGYSQFNNEWVNLAIKNSLMESDYSLGGGVTFKVSVKSEVKSDILSVVDILTGENVLGKDITKKLEISENDISVLSPRDTFFQSAGILLNLKKGSNAQFPSRGLSITPGSNINSVDLPSVFNKLSEVIKNDDTIKSFEVIGSEKRGEGIFISIKLVSKFSDVEVNEQLKL